MQVRYLIVAAIVLAAAPAAAQSPKIIHVTYRCGHLAVPVTYDNVRDVALIKYGSRSYALPQVRSADGGRYMNAHIEWWSKGRTARLSSVHNGEADALLSECSQTTK